MSSDTAKTENTDKPEREPLTMPEIARYLRIGKYTMALGPLANLTTFMGSIFEGSEKTRETVRDMEVGGVKLSTLAEATQWQLAHTFSLIAVAKARGDWLRIADLLEYEIEPRLAAARASG